MPVCLWDSIFLALQTNMTTFRLEFFQGEIPACQICVDRFVGGPAVSRCGRCPPTLNRTMLREPVEPPQPLCKKLGHFHGAPNLFCIPFVQGKVSVSTRYNFILSNQILSDIDTVQQPPTDQTEMLGGSIRASWFYCVVHEN